MSEAVREILEQIDLLPDKVRPVLEELLTEVEWKLEAESARLVRERGIDRAAIDRAIHDLRYTS